MAFSGRGTGSCASSWVDGCRLPKPPTPASPEPADGEKADYATGFAETFNATNCANPCQRAPKSCGRICGHHGLKRLAAKGSGTTTD